MRRALHGSLLRPISHVLVLVLLNFSTFLPAVAGRQLNPLPTPTDNLQLLKTSDDLLTPLLQPKTGKNTKLIVQLNGPLSLTLQTLISVLGGTITATFNNLDAFAVTIPETSLLQLSLLSNITYMSLDRPVALMGHISTTSGAEAVRTSGPLGSTLDGTGVGIAVLDSGVYVNHKSFEALGAARVVVNKDFTGERRTDDAFGHGSHVAAIAAGNGNISNGAYKGIAPNASLLNLRVLNSQGEGTTSGLLAAMDWLISNRVIYNVRVVNLSLGAAAIDSYLNDPICKAARKLVNAGVVVVAAAGNNGRNENNQKVYGQIHSPGIEPSVITIGASNTFNTDSRYDDGVTTYSSRGPTRGSWSDTSGLKHYDNLVKPDLVAPGNKIVSAEAPGNLLVTQHPELDMNVSTDPTRNMMQLSGTSMATPVVSGAVALMLQANPKLSPGLIKSILMYTAQPLAGFNQFEQGTGELNIEGSIRLAQLVRKDLSNSTALGESMLTGGAPVPRSTFAGCTFNWSQGINFSFGYGVGSDLITRYQKFYGLGYVLSDGVTVENGVLVRTASQMTPGVMIGQNITTSSGVIAGDGTVFCSSGVLLADGTFLSDSQIFGDGVIAGDSRGVIAGDTRGVIAGDSTPPSTP